MAAPSRKEPAEQRAHVIKRYRSLLAHWLGRAISPTTKCRSAVPDEPPPGSVALGFAGHSTFVIKLGGVVIVTDPMFGNWYRGVHRRTEAGYRGEDLPDCDLILISRVDKLHLHVASMKTLPRAAAVVVPPGGAARLSGLGFARVLEIAPGQTLDCLGIEIVACDVGCPRGSAALSFVIRGSGRSLYYTGDSAYFDGFAAIGKAHSPDIALLPIGGYSPRSLQRNNMTPLDAMAAFFDLGARVLVPHRHGAFALSYEKIDDPISWLDELIAEGGLENYVFPLEPGDSKRFYAVVRRAASNAARSAQPAEDAPEMDLEIDFEDAPLSPAAMANDAENIEGKRERSRPTAQIAPTGRESPTDLRSALTSKRHRAQNGSNSGSDDR